MKKASYTSLWVLLSLALIVFLGISFVDDINIGDYVIKKAPFKEHLLASVASENDSISQPDASLMDQGGFEEPVVVTTDSLPQSIFIFGDSMTFNLALRLAQYAKQNGHSIHAVNWDSSNTKIWAESDTLLYYLGKYRPSQVFISLGSNELYLKNPDSRIKYVNRILQMIDTIPYIWIGPPNWKEDSGINDMLERECRKGMFFRSAGMHFDRKADKIHPTRESSALWVDSIMRWLPTSAHPFIADLPSDSIGKPNPNIVFLKAKNK